MHVPSFGIPYILLSILRPILGTRSVSSQKFKQCPHLKSCLSTGFPFILPFVLMPLLGARSASSRTPQHRTHMTSFIFLMISLHFTLHAEATPWCTFSEFTKIPAPHTPEILHAPHKLLTMLPFILRPLLGTQSATSQHPQHRAHMKYFILPYDSLTCCSPY